MQNSRHACVGQFAVAGEKNRSIRKMYKAPVPKAEATAGTTQFPAAKATAFYDLKERETVYPSRGNSPREHAPLDPPDICTKRGFNHASMKKPCFSLRGGGRGCPSRARRVAVALHRMKVIFPVTEYRIGRVQRRHAALTEGGVVGADVVARGELRRESGFPDFRCTQHAHFVSSHPLAAGVLLRLHAGELRGRAGKKGEKRG